MRRAEDFLGEDEGFFGPGSDLAISLVALLILMIAVQMGRDQKEQHGQLEIRSIRERQLRLIDAVAAHYSTTRVDLGNGRFGIHAGLAEPEDPPDIVIQNDATLQRISFGGHVLFPDDQVRLLSRGRSVLGALASVLKSDLEPIQEIHIQGHADLRPSARYRSNLELAAYRAMAVYHTLQDQGIDPVRSVMSATTFGEYVPAARDMRDPDYSLRRLRRDNQGKDRQRLNRRIEVLLIYRRSDPESQRPPEVRLSSDPRGL